MNPVDKILGNNNDYNKGFAKGEADAYNEQDMNLYILEEASSYSDGYQDGYYITEKKIKKKR